MMVPEYVYVIAASPAGPVKIGWSVDPDRRCRQLQTGHPEPLTVYHQVAAVDACNLEGYIHQEFGHKRQTGEWFDMTPAEAVDLIAWAQMVVESAGPSSVISVHGSEAAAEPVGGAGDGESDPDVNNTHNVVVE